MGLFNFSQKPQNKLPYYIRVSTNDLKKELSYKSNSIVLPSKSYRGAGVVHNTGIDDIVLGETTAYHVQQSYGLAYDVFDISGHAIEMKYFQLGLSCFFQQNDPKRRIFSVRIWKDHNAFKPYSDSMPPMFIDGDLTLHDVFTAHMTDVEYQKSYDETYFVDLGFYSYHFFVDESSGSEISIPIESIVLKKVLY